MESSHYTPAASDDCLGHMSFSFADLQALQYAQMRSAGLEPPVVGAKKNKVSGLFSMFKKRKRDEVGSHPYLPVPHPYPRSSRSSALEPSGHLCTELRCRLEGWPTSGW